MKRADECSALPWTPHEIENASHGYELPPIHHSILRLSKAQMGVGGDDSWGSHTHEEFLVKVKDRIHFSFSFNGDLLKRSYLNYLEIICERAVKNQNNFLSNIGLKLGHAFASFAT